MKPDDDLATAYAIAKLKEQLLRKGLPFLLLGAAAAGIGLPLLAGPALGLAGFGVTAAAVFGGFFSVGMTFGYADRFSDKFGHQALCLSSRMPLRQITQVEEEFKKTLPLKGEAKKAFIQSLTSGIRDALHIRKPLNLAKAPHAALRPARPTALRLKPRP